MKLYVKLRRSGEVKQVNEIGYTGNVWLAERLGSIRSNVFQLGDDCDLCDEQGRLLVPVQPATIPVSDALAFAEWCGSNYHKCHGGWFPLYADQRDKSNLKTTAELYEYWKTNIKPQTT